MLRLLLNTRIQSMIRVQEKRNVTQSYGHFAPFFKGSKAVNIVEGWHGVSDPAWVFVHPCFSLPWVWG